MAASHSDTMQNTAHNQIPLSQLLSLKSSDNIQSPVSNTKKGFRKIGFGQCGLIFSSPRGNVAIKLARPFFADALWNDLLCHMRVIETFENLQELECRIPRVYSYIPKSNSTWWDQHMDVFEEQKDFPIPTMALCTQRILPVPSVVRTKLIDLYCPTEFKAVAMQNPSNEDCLARIYLGRSRPKNAPKAPNFTLRNFNLHLDQMIELELPIHDYARAIGEALAVIHWSANVDAYDIEFVLGSHLDDDDAADHETAADVKRSSSASEIENMEPHTSLNNIMNGGAGDTRRSSSRLWVLDFNLCSRWDMNEVLASGNEAALINHLVQAFFGNDPYYPIPREYDDDYDDDRKKSEDAMRYQLWSTFSSAYIDKGRGIINILRPPLRDEISLPNEEEEPALAWTHRLRNPPAEFIAGCVEEARKGQDFKGGWAK